MFKSRLRFSKIKIEYKNEKFKCYAFNNIFVRPEICDFKIIKYFSVLVKN